VGRLGGEPERVDQRLKLLAVFTEPQVAAVGLSEREAAEARQDIRTATYPFQDHGRAVLEGETDGSVKLVAERGSGRLLGAAAVGPRAAELIHELVAVLYYRGTAQDLVAMPHYHPTLSEVWTFPAQQLAAGDG
jgi:pyruvate/2-oxoglutarate dehydrogenase complex dihydrolipoamide dehydrogenase (E3) component